jgi:ribose/xylose/arabinose/galactoside ABC-type transport system permease subunit
MHGGKVMNTIKKYRGIGEFFQKNVMIVILIGLVIVMTNVNSNFFTVANGLNILRSMAVQGIMACGVTVLLIGGELDLSFGSTVGLTSVIVTQLCTRLPEAGVSIDAAAVIGIVVALAAGLGIGAVNAFFVVKWKVPALLVTLAMQFTVYGISGSITGGYPNYTLPSWWSFWGKDKIGELPICVIILLLVFVVFYFVMGHTKFGRTIYAVGGNAESARLSGINVAKYKFSMFMIVQVMAVLAGFVFSSQLMSGTANYGSGSEFLVIAAVIIGGTSLNGGSGTMIGSFIGLLFMSVIMNAMTIANISEYPQYVVRGLIMLFAIWLSSFQSVMAEKRKIKLKE